MSDTECKDAFVIEPTEDPSTKDTVKGSMQRLFRYGLNNYTDSDHRLLIIMEPPKDDTNTVKEVWKCVQEYLFQEIPFLLIRFDQDPEWNPFALLLRISRRCEIWRPCNRNASAAKIIGSLISEGK